MPRSNDAADRSHDDQLNIVLSRAQGRRFLGPQPLATQVRHARGLADIVGAVSSPGDTWVDLGSGAGMPGLVCALELPRLSWILLDSADGRTAFLREAVDDLALGERVSVLTGRAEAVARDPAYRERVDGVVARSFGPPAVVAECAAGLLRVGGALVVSEPPDDIDRWPAEGLAALGLAVEQRYVTPVRAVVLRKEAPLAATYPRRVGQPAKRPLF